GLAGGHVRAIIHFQGILDIERFCPSSSLSSAVEPQVLAATSRTCRRSDSSIVDCAIRSTGLHAEPQVYPDAIRLVDLSLVEASHLLHGPFIISLSPAVASFRL